MVSTNCLQRRVPFVVAADVAPGVGIDSLCFACVQRFGYCHRRFAFLLALCRVGR